MTMRIFKRIVTAVVIVLPGLISCKEGVKEQPPAPVAPFYFGADLSYVNQILDHHGVYKDQGDLRSPYKIFKDHGANLARFRLWHNPVWTKTVYGDQGTQLYNDLADVEKAIGLAKAEGLPTELDFHYSDTWADPGKQEIPAAWNNIKDVSVLTDSVYRYTLKTLQYLNSKGLMPEMVQVGNEINCGMMFTNAPAGFPALNACDNHWSALGQVLNGAIKAVREVAAASGVKTKVILHVADPKNVVWWFDNIKSSGAVSDFDIIGFSYYPLWHTSIAVDQLSDNVKSFKSKYGKDIMIMETAYPWTADNDDSYANAFVGQAPIAGYPYTAQGQSDMMKKITQEMIDGGGSGVIYWEPAWITSDLKDLWGKGSSWENNALFDFSGNVVQGMEYMNYQYTR